MNRHRNSSQWIIENAIPWLILAVLLTYTYAKFFMHYYGFRFDTSGNILFVFSKEREPTLEVGDRLIQVGQVRWQDFHDDLSKTLFEGNKPGDVIPIIVERDGQTIAIPWMYPGLNKDEFFDQFFSEWWLAYFFWLAGALTVLLVRPHDERWLLFSAFNFLTAIWLIAGSGVSMFHIWYSALVLRMVIWLCVPVYLHLHWVFPRSLGKLPPLLIGGLYAAASMLAIAEGFRLLPYGSYSLGFVVALAGSAALLIAHAICQPETRRDLQNLFTVALIAFLPAIVWGIADIFVTLRIGGYDVLAGALLSLPLIPLVYLYIAFRRQLGEFELRANRFMGIYFFLILLATAFVPLIALTEQLPNFPGKTLLIGIVSSSLTAAAFLWILPPFQRFAERAWLGISTPAEQIQEVYSARATVSTSINALTDLLKEIMLPSLLVRQFLFIRFEAGIPRPVLMVGLDEKHFSSDQNLSKLLALKDAPPGDLQKDKPYPWVRLVLPLKAGEEVVGLWLLGRRDPDDFYSQHELPILRSLANQTAIALSNIVQTERLHAAYQDSIKRSEQGRQHIALELHDDILNKMAALIMKMDDQSLTPEFQKSYSELTAQLRNLVKDLRPPMLNYGLHPAIEGYTDTLMDRSGGKVQVVVDLKWDGSCRHPQDVEQHLFRIVQEATANALRHANPNRVTISGTLEPDLIEINVQDDGSGFSTREKLDLSTLQAENHFGLTGMFERAELIGADIKVESEPMKGTNVQISWRPHKTQA